MKNLYASVLFLLLGLRLSEPASAHHSLSDFDMEHTVEIQGVIVEFQWTNPHTLIVIEVNGEDGGTTRWELEGVRPSLLTSRGWTMTTLKPGDHVSMIVHPLKNGKPGGTLDRVILADGTVKYNTLPKDAP